MPDQSPSNRPVPAVSLLTGGRDSPYALGLAGALLAADCTVDFIGSDEVNPSGLAEASRLHFYNLRGDQSVQAGLAQKIRRVLAYYVRLIHYAATARPKIFHILWVNKFEWFEQTVLMAYYKLLGKKICFTAHNVNKAARDGHDSLPNRLALEIQYHLCDHIFVHTGRMKTELATEFHQLEAKITVIPFGLNNVLPVTALTGAEARRRLGLGAQDKVMLFFGNIAPYKGLEFLVAAFDLVAPRDPRFRLVIAGRPKGDPEYWTRIREAISRSPAGDRIRQVIEYIPDAETECYFKAADVSVLPYVQVYQSGVLSLSYSFGLPVLAADVGSLREEIVEGRTGWVFAPENPAELARRIQVYFESDVYRNLDRSRAAIQEFARDKYSWTRVAALTTAVYAQWPGANLR